MKHIHSPRVLSIHKEKAIRTAFLKAKEHPGIAGWVAEHGGNFGTDSLHFHNRYKKQIIFAAALIENETVCRWQYIGFTKSNPTEIKHIVWQAGFQGLGGKSHQEYLQILKDFLIVSSGKFIDRMPLYINYVEPALQIGGHNREYIRDLALKFLSKGHLK